MAGLEGFDAHLDNYGDPDPQEVSASLCPVDGEALAELTESGEPRCGECGWVYHNVCCYSARHAATDVPSVTVIDCGRVGMIPACQECADFYARNTR